MLMIFFCRFAQVQTHSDSIKILSCFLSFSAFKIMEHQSFRHSEWMGTLCVRSWTNMHWFMRNILEEMSNRRRTTNNRRWNGKAAIQHRNMSQSEKTHRHSLVVICERTCLLSNLKMFTWMCPTVETMNHRDEFWQWMLEHKYAVAAKSAF